MLYTNARIGASHTDVTLHIASRGNGKRGKGLLGHFPFFRIRTGVTDR